MAYYYTRDHLGSIRELINSSGTIVARYDYDPYGKTTLVSGTDMATFQYTGDYYHHAASGLNLTWFRAYDANTARWLSRDPLGEGVGPNLYGYVDNSPINGIDPLGLAPNKAGITNSSHVHDALALDPSLDNLSETHGDNTNRYFYTDKYGWVDIRHFGKAASMTHGWSPPWLTKGLGVANETAQWLTEWGDDYRSGFSPEDCPSNAAGADFGKSIKPGESIVDAFDRWAKDAYTRDLNDPALYAELRDLPATDPSERGGKGRGSSNASSHGPPK